MNKTGPFALMDPVTVLSGIGSKRAETLQKLEINTIEDLLRHYPRRYEDRRRIVPVGSLKDGEAALLRVKVLRVVKAPPFSNSKAKRIPMKVYCGDESGELTLLFFNARWLQGLFDPGTEYWVYGIARKDIYGISMAHPDFDPVSSGEDRGAGQIIPVYNLTEGITQKYLRGLIRSALKAVNNIEENLPHSIVMKRKLAPPGFALKNIHFPEDEHAYNAARYRLVYEELFLLQLRMLRLRKSSDALRPEGSRLGTMRTAEEVFSIFPFELTGAQRRVIEQIRFDMEADVPMRRLLQGDVGSGKTAVAAAAAFFAAENGCQSAIMAPTEILATQHFYEFEKLFRGTGIRVGLLASGLPAAHKRETRHGLASGEIRIAIGTHALIEPDVLFANLGLVVTDEQHRFGVRQRLALKEKGAAPDTLVMTATPIPRTLAMMLYADLDVSSLDEMPPGRKKVTTRFIDTSKRDAAYGFAEKEISAGRQVYVVTPKIGDEADEDENENEDGVQLTSALALTDELRGVFPNIRIASLHGRMSSELKEEVMSDFVNGNIDLLVSTVVIEVGVNVPNATVMIIENAERFGLAQLHQLRGRVGRGAAKSYCVLISDSKSETAVNRLETLAREHDGFRIAELDLSLRGPGDIFGTRQHGLPVLKIADIAEHRSILQLAHEDAKAEMELCG